MSRLLPAAARRRQWAILMLIAAVSISGQLLFQHYFPPRASVAGASGLSASLGLANGQGMTIAPSEGIEIKTRITPSTEIRSLYSPNEDRLPLLEPLPGLVLIYFLIGTTGLPLTLNLLSLVNVVLLAAGSTLLAAELMKRRLALGTVAGLAIAAFVPLYRLSIIVGYDTFEFLLVVLAVVCLLKFQRTNHRVWLLLNAICLGFGMWIRAYFILYAAAHLIVVSVLILRRKASWRNAPWRNAPWWMVAGWWMLPVILLTVGLISVRDAGSIGTRLTRGAFWHTFWAGVGQFENEQIEGSTDWDVCRLARDLGHATPCDPSYTDPDQAYLFQYDAEYNAVLEEQAREWIPDLIPQLVSNTMARFLWMAIPGLAPSSKIDSHPVVRAGAVLLSLVILLFVATALVRARPAAREEIAILLGTYAALAPLTAFYLIAKVLIVSYFCVIVVACMGLVATIFRPAMPAKPNTV